MKLRAFATILMMLVWVPVASADWVLPIAVSAGGASTSVAFGVQTGASNGYDTGHDTPHMPYDGEVVYASFPHPEWGVVIGGEAITGFQRDMRGSLPQEYSLEVRSTQPQVTLSWNSSSLPARTTFLLTNPSTGGQVDLSSSSSYTFAPGGTTPVQLKISVSQGDVSPPAEPGGVTIEERGNALFVSWDRNSESDLAGYKVHFGTNSGSYRRTIDVRNVTNYSLMNLQEEEYYYVAITAYDEDGNESDYSYEVSSSYGIDTVAPLSPVGLQLNATETSLVLSWSPNLETDLQGYKVYVGSSYGSFSKAYSVGTATSYSVLSPVAGQTYYLAVTAVDEKGNESELSSSVSGELLAEVPEVPEEDELPEESGTSAVVGSTRSSSIYINMPGQTTTGTTQGSGGGSSQPEQRKQEQGGGTGGSAGSGSSTSSDDSVSAAEVVTSVPVLREVQKLEFDAHTWKLMTIPLKVSLNKPFKEFVALGAEMNRLIGWDPVKQEYLRLKYPRPGTAFWLKAGKGHAVVAGLTYPHDKAIFSLTKGWNLIGSPFLKNAAFGNARIKVADQKITLVEAVRMGKLDKSMQGYEKGAFTVVPLDKPGAFKPWQGYWVKAKEPCELILSLKTPQTEKPKVARKAPKVKAKDGN